VARSRGLDCDLGGGSGDAIPAYQFLKQFNGAVDILTDKYGVNTFLAKALAAVLFTPVAVGVKRSFFGLRKSGPRGALLTGLYAAVYFLGMYAVSRNAAFTHSEGKVLQWYSDTPEGLRFFDSPGFDPKYGIALRPVTPEMKVAQARRERGQVPQSVPATNLSQLQLFDPLTGDPRYWYYRSPTGDFELFDGPGFHPQNQQLLVALDAAAVVELSRWLQGREEAATRATQLDFRDRYVDPGARRQTTARRWVVLITDSGNDPVPTLIAAGGQALTAKGITLASVFRPAFVRDRLNQQLYEGDPSLAQRLALHDVCEGVVLGALGMTIAKSSEAEGMHTARASLKVRVITAGSGSVVQEFVLSSLVLGSRRTPRGRATERLVTPLRDRLAAGSL
jgi:hypothetical protein